MRGGGEGVESLAGPRVRAWTADWGLNWGWKECGVSETPLFLPKEKLNRWAHGATGSSGSGAPRKKWSRGEAHTEQARKKKKESEA